MAKRRTLIFLKLPLQFYGLLVYDHGNMETTDCGMRGLVDGSVGSLGSGAHLLLSRSAHSQYVRLELS